MPKTTIMIQARTSSTRLPNKVLAKIEDKPMIWHIINRVKRVKSVHQIALITTKSRDDKILLKIAQQNGIIGFAGKKSDVLDRHYQCAKKINADPIIRITSDCPLVDPLLVEKIVRFYNKNKYDFVSNAIFPTYPDGLDVEVFSFKALQKAAKLAKKKYDREHVTTFFTNNPNKFKIYNYRNSKNLAHMRWTVDRKEDLKFVKIIYSRMRPNKIFSMNKVLTILKKEPRLLEINNGIMRNEGHLKSTYNELYRKKS
jgi:spore coat polysaccharide biosynthesis protein SpsF (cytidylyltransferase family)